MKIEHEIQQKAFKNEFIKAHINILFSSSWVRQQLTHLLWPYNISAQQLNILRILRGKHPAPATLKEITGKMIDRMSNTSRLVEKLKQKKLVNRKRCENNRRQVNVSITDLGLEVVEEASQIVECGIINSMNTLSTEEVEILNKILDKLRG